MERRSGKRKAIDVEVIVDSSRRPAVRGSIGNVGFGGMFVHLAPVGLSKDVPVDILIAVPQDSGLRLYRMPAVVAWIAENGVGLAFNEYDVTAFRTLVVLLLALQKSALATGAAVANRFSLSNGSGSDAAPAREDTTRVAASAANSLVSMS